MIASNANVTSYRLTTSGSKDTYAVVTTVQGVPVFIAPERLEIASFVDQDNAFDVFRLTCDRYLDIEEHDRITDDRDGITYTVHSVNKERGVGYTETTCVIQKVR